MNLKKTCCLRENDASCFVLGEALRLGKNCVAGLTLGTGVGGGVVIDGKLFAGTGNAGEFGHCTICLDGTKCECGSAGCLEQYVSAKGVRKQFGKEPTALSKREWKRFGSFLGVGIANIINSFAPEAVVLGGGISRAFNLFKEAMEKEVARRVFAGDALRKAKIRKGRKDSAIIGAANLFRSKGKK